MLILKDRNPSRNLTDDESSGVWPAVLESCVQLLGCQSILCTLWFSANPLDSLWFTCYLGRAKVCYLCKLRMPGLGWQKVAQFCHHKPCYSRKSLIFKSEPFHHWTLSTEHTAVFITENSCPKASTAGIDAPGRQRRLSSIPRFQYKQLTIFLGDLKELCGSISLDENKNIKRDICFE
jgi:hypothetical protein